MTRSPHEEYRRDRLRKRRARAGRSHTFDEAAYQPHDKTRSLKMVFQSVWGRGLTARRR